MGLFTAKDARELSNSASIAGDLEGLNPYYYGTCILRSQCEMEIANRNSNI